MTWPQKTRFGCVQLVSVFLIRSDPASFVRRWHRARRDELSHNSLGRPELFRPDSYSRDTWTFGLLWPAKGERGPRW
jgi:hypothetical protein